MDLTGRAPTDEPAAAPPARRADIEADMGGLVAVAAELDGIEAALARIDAGSYGQCVACGVAVDDALLEADPLRVTCAHH